MIVYYHINVSRYLNLVFINFPSLSIVPVFAPKKLMTLFQEIRSLFSIFNEDVKFHIISKFFYYLFLFFSTFVVDQANESLLPEQSSYLIGI